MPQGTAETTKRWWEKSADKAHESISATVQTYLQFQKERVADLAEWYRAYGYTNAAGIAASEYFRPKDSNRRRLSFNVTKSCVDTVVSKITKNRPKPTFLTSGGSWEEQKKARLLDKFCRGLFYQTKAYESTGKAFRDATIFGTGALKVFEDPKTHKVKIERVLIHELLVDEVEALYGSPSSIHQRRLVSKDELKGMFPGQAAAEIIEKAETATENSNRAGKEAGDADLVAVIESWHLPSVEPPECSDAEIKKIAAKRRDELLNTRDLENLEPDEKAEIEAEADKAVQKYLMDGHDGRHIISVTSGCLYAGAWRDDFFPFVFTHWTDPVLGFWGMGIPEELAGIQHDINATLRQIQRCLPFAVPRGMARAGTKFVKQSVSDVEGTWTMYTGPAPGPQISTTSVIAPELFEHLDRLTRAAYEFTGVSMLAAQAKKPAGLESGAALREMNDIESERFADRFRSYEELHLNLARLAIRTVRQIAKRRGGYQVTSSKKVFTEKIEWNAIDLDDDAFVMQVFPTSMLPQTPAGRLAMVQDLMNLGFLGQEDALRLLNFPDLEAVNELAEASAEYTSYQIERMFEKGEPEYPQPYQNLDYAQSRAQAAYLLGITVKVGDSKLQLLRDYIDACAELKKKAMEAALAAQAAAQGPPPAAPGSAPSPSPSPKTPAPAAEQAAA